MKRINKQEPAFFKEFVRKKNPADWSETKEISFSLREHILANEQNYQCAYTEIDVLPDSHSSHIDHFRKRCMFPNLTFEYANLFTCSINESYGAKFKDKIVKEADYAELINPSKENPTDYFEYTLDGYI